MLLTALRHIYLWLTAHFWYRKGWSKEILGEALEEYTTVPEYDEQNRIRAFRRVPCSSKAPAPEQAPSKITTQTRSDTQKSAYMLTDRIKAEKDIHDVPTTVLNSNFDFSMLVNAVAEQLQGKNSKPTIDTTILPLSKPEEKRHNGVTIISPEARLNSIIDRLNWDGLPDGDMERQFSHEDCAVMGKPFFLSWAHTSSGSGRAAVHQSIHSPTVDGGRVRRFKCLGVFYCSNEQCQVYTRPYTTSTARQQQIGSACLGTTKRQCGAPLQYQPCTNVIMELIDFARGSTFRHRGIHGHNPPSRPLHPTPDGRHDFEEAVSLRPDAGPRQLIQGPRQIDGPGRSVAEFSPVYENVHRVGRDRLNLQRRMVGDSGDSFIAGLVEIHKEGEFIIQQKIETETIISMQTPWMRKQLVTKELHDAPVNGIVNDAAHGFFKNENTLLMVSSVYCSDLDSWIPVLWSYLDGATIQHFRWHFRALFESIAQQASEDDIEVVDALFASVMDFSEAESGGYVEAFVDFWQSHSEDSRTEDDLRQAARSLLRGCAEHFRASVTRIARNGAVIPSGEAEQFKQQAMGLLYAKDMDHFRKLATQLVQGFPNAASWILWWLRDAHARMVFASVRVMNPVIWNSIPATTNAQESLHFAAYASCGRNHAFLPGIKQLKRLAETFQRRWVATEGKYTTPRASSLLKISLHLAGMRTDWGKKRAHIRTTQPKKPSDEREIKDSQGRPPDTTDELVGRNAASILKKQTGSRQTILDLKSITLKPTRRRTDVTLAFPSWIWESNSCALDTSLELLNAAISRDYADFIDSFSLDLVAANNPLRSMFECLDSRRKLEVKSPANDELTAELVMIRNTFRQYLASNSIIRGMDTPESLWGWLWHLLRIGGGENGYNAGCAFFETLVTEVHQCSGPTTNEQHVEIVSPPWRRTGHILTQNDFNKFRGDITDWFRNYVTLHLHFKAQKTGCFRRDSGCTGNRRDIRNIVVSIPTILIIEIDPLTSPTSFWKIPGTLTPLTRALANEVELVYDLVGLGFYHHAEPPGISHFTTRFSSADQAKVYNYDDMKFHGFVTEENKAKFISHLVASSKNIPLPNGSVVHSVVYRLRGGSLAQLEFMTRRREELQKKLKIRVDAASKQKPMEFTYIEKKYVEIRQSEASWTLRDNHREYAALSVAESTKQGDHTSKRKGLAHTHGAKVVRRASNHQETLELEQPDNAKADIKPKPIDYNSQPDDRVPEGENKARLATPSVWSLACRCGHTGNANEVFDLLNEGETICCDECGQWSHQACQKDGYTSLLKPTEPFSCHRCKLDDLQVLAPSEIKKRTAAQRRRWINRSKKDLSDRLRPGIGGLARNGTYWYPVRLILLPNNDSQWRVKWWRGCIFESDSLIEPAMVTSVERDDLVDALWGDAHKRRQIRLGQWTLAAESSVEDILVNPESMPFTEEIHKALEKHIKQLRKLMSTPGKVPSSDVPAKKWLEGPGRLTMEGRIKLVPFVGSLSIQQRAQIQNWFHINVADRDQRKMQRWLGKVPIAHAFTLFIASEMQQRDTHPNDGETSDLPLEEAWNQLHSVHSPVSSTADPDQEAVERLEEMMFEQSRAAGVAGNWQWGLDMGDHQNRWNPYDHAPPNWNHGDRPGSDIELERGPNYVEVVIEAPKPKRPRPRPRQLRKRK